MHACLLHRDTEKRHTAIGMSLNKQARVRVLDLSENVLLRDSGAVQLAGALGDAAALQTLRLDDVGMTSQGVVLLAAALRTAPALSLTHLTLNRNGRLEAAALAGLNELMRARRSLVNLEVWPYSFACASFCVYYYYRLAVCRHARTHASDTERNRRSQTAA